MDGQVLSYKVCYHLSNSFTADFLEQSPSIFNQTRLSPPNASKALPEKVNPLSPRELHEQQRRRSFNRILQQIDAADLPGKVHVHDYIIDKFRRNRKEATLRSNGTALRFFLTFLKASGKDRLEDINRQDIEAYVEYEQDRGLKIKAVKTRLMVIYNFIGHLIEKDILPPELLTKRIRLKMPDLLPRAIEPADLKKIFTAVDDIRDKALLLLLLRTGMRIGELLDLQLPDVNLQERKIMIYIGEKNCRGRVVYFSDDAQDALGAWLEIRDPGKQGLFYSKTHHRLSYNAVRMMFNKYQAKAGLSHKRYTLHQLRHTYATELLNAGMRIECLQPLLGHSCLEMTRRYARLSDRSREKEYFRAMSIIERGMTNEGDRLDHKLQAALEEKELLAPHS